MTTLNQITVFNQWVYTTLVEVIDQQIQLFNEATRGALLLNSKPFVGDFSDSAMWAIMSNLVRRRNAYGNADVAAIDLKMIVDTMVKVAAGTPPVSIPPSTFTWIQKSPDEAGVVIGQQLAEQTLADMLNTALMCLSAAIGGQASNTLDVSGGTDEAAKFNPVNTNLALGKMGDRRSGIVCWVAHSKTMTDYFGNALTNNERLFNYGTVNVITDPFGNPFVITDSPSLVVTGTPDKYVNLGLQPAAAIIARNEDFTDNLETSNGKENIQRTYQAEWTYNVGLRGFAWDKATGGKSPTNAALGTAANWDKVATSHKDLAGIKLITV